MTMAEMAIKNGFKFANTTQGKQKKSSERAFKIPMGNLVTIEMK